MQRNVNIPVELQEFDFISVLTQPDVERTYLFIMGEHINHLSKRPVIRLFVLEEAFNNQLEVVEEIGSYEFDNQENALQFASRLPEMKALEFILLMNTQRPPKGMLN